MPSQVAALAMLGTAHGEQFEPHELTSLFDRHTPVQAWKVGLHAPLQMVLSVALTQAPLHSLNPLVQV